jgi:hypothetical protein
VSGVKFYNWFGGFLFHLLALAHKSRKQNRRRLKKEETTTLAFEKKRLNGIFLYPH